MSKLPMLMLVSMWVCACGADDAATATPASSSAPTGVALTKSDLARASDPSRDDVAAVGTSNQAFACDLFQRLAADGEGHNLVISPYSISTALAMAYAGARAQTEAEMKTALHFDLEQPRLHAALNAIDLALAERGAGKAGADNTPFRLEASNAFWQQRDFAVEAPYLDTLAVNYGSGVFLVDFAAQPETARAAINSWVSKLTDALIPELLPPQSISSGTRLVLTNAVYFNASWRTKFEASATADARFTKIDGTEVSTPFMHAAHEFGFAEGDGYRAVSLPYADDQLSFIAVLPDDDAYAKVEAELSATWFETLLKALSRTEVAVALPKLDFAMHKSLRPQLRALGMVSAFDSTADFSGITRGSLQINDVIHEAVIKVIEGGTIAAAATAVTFKDGGMDLSRKVVSLDHPFIFAIVDRSTHTLLFLGRVLDPTAN